MSKRAGHGAAHRNHPESASGNTVGCLLFLFLLFSALASSAQQAQAPPLEIARAARPPELLSVLGTRAGILGAESGHFEAWAYPLKILRDFHLVFLTGGQSLPADAVVRSIVIRPESTTLIYASDSFSVEETIFVPRDKPGAVVTLTSDTAVPLEIEAAFTRDLQLEWPAPLGAASLDYLPRRNAFALTELSGHYTAIVGSPTGHQYQEEASTHALDAPQSTFKLGALSRGRAVQQIAIAASLAGSPASAKEAESLYTDLLTHAGEWQARDSQFYVQALEANLRLTLPDATLEQAYRWAEVSMLQGVVDNPFLGTGLVAGYDQAGDSTRPGYAWFFGRDALWTTLALTAEGDYATARIALAFLARYERADGKLPHEISQGATFVPWFTELPYAWASADATPLFLIAIDDYVTRSGDIAFASDLWPKLQNAYSFLNSTRDAQGLPANAGIGHGWIEGGPLFPLKAELYQSALGLQATRAMAHLAALTGRPSMAQEFAGTFAQRAHQLDDVFWLSEKNHYAAGLDVAAGKPVDVPSVLATVPMWWELLDAEHANAMITELSRPEHTADWGMRILSENDPRFDPNGYHWGTVWPLFTGWASVAEYRYHRPLPAFQNLQTNALLTFAGASGHVAEVLSGSYFGTLETGSPHQIWSSAMVVSPLLRGLLGLAPDAAAHTLLFAPHIPAAWSALQADNIAIGAARVSLGYARTPTGITLRVSSSPGEGPAPTITFSPSLSLRARVQGATLDGHRVPLHIEQNGNDQHVSLSFKSPPTGATVHLSVAHDFALDEPARLPLGGARSQGVHVLEQHWSADRSSLVLDLSGDPGRSYEFPLSDATEIVAVSGGTLQPAAVHGNTHPVLVVAFPQDGASLRHVVLTFRPLGL